ncbi:MAG: hypothetical protein JAY68_17140 [Candidatus Thiodiazotropha taylori]|nr:hypothetical protein [Candidatus Thiodiazotropha taylori]
MNLMNRFTRLMLPLVVAVIVISGCSTMSTTEIDNKRKALDGMADGAITRIVEKDSSVQSALDQGLAWGVADIKLTKVPVVGAGGGEGVLFIKDSGERIYFTVSRLDIGGGWGARAYKALMIFADQAVLDDWKSGEWVFTAGAEASAGTAAAEGGTGGSGDDGFTMHLLADGGASATATARVIRIKINQELTDAE